MNHIDKETEAAVCNFLALIAPRFDMAGAIVYGSRARGTHRSDSDADVAVLLKNGAHQRFLTTKLAMADLAFDVLLDTGSSFHRCRFGWMSGSTLKPIPTPPCCATLPKKEFACDQPVNPICIDGKGRPRLCIRPCFAGPW